MPKLGARQDARFRNRMYKNWFHTPWTLESNQEYLKRGGKAFRE